MENPIGRTVGWLISTAKIYDGERAQRYRQAAAIIQSQQKRIEDLELVISNIVSDSQQAATHIESIKAMLDLGYKKEDIKAFNRFDEKLVDEIIRTKSKS